MFSFSTSFAHFRQIYNFGDHLFKTKTEIQFWISNSTSVRTWQPLVWPIWFPCLYKCGPFKIEISQKCLNIRGAPVKNSFLFVCLDRCSAIAKQGSKEAATISLR